MKKEISKLQRASMEYGSTCWLLNGVKANIKRLCLELQVDYENLDEHLQELYITLEEANESRAKRKGVIIRK